MATRLSAVVSRVSQCVYVNQLFTIYHVCQALITAYAADSTDGCNSGRPILMAELIECAYQMCYSKPHVSERQRQR